MEIDEVKKALNEGLEKTQDNIKADVDQKIKPVSEKVDGVDERLKKIEDTPVGKGVNVNSKFEKKYRGYNLSSQGKGLLEKVSKKKEQFPTLNDGEKMHNFKKFLIDFVRREVHKDFSSTEGMEAMQKAAMQEDTNSEGGYLVPEEYYGELIKLGREATFALSQCNVIPMKRDIMNIPAESSLVDVAWKAEEAAAGQNDPTFEQVQLNAKKLTAYAISTNELLEDADYDIVSILTEQFAYKTQQELDNQVLNGTGDPCSGILTAKVGNSVVTSGSDFSSVAADDFSEALYKVGKKYRDNARFVVGQIALHYIRTLKDNNNAPIFARPGGAVPGTIYGQSYIESPQVTDTTSSSTAFGVYGNLKKVLIGRRKGAMKLDVDPYGKFLENQTRFRIVTRWDIEVAIAEAFCRIMTSS